MGEIRGGVGEKRRGDEGKDGMGVLQELLEGESENK